MTFTTLPISTERPAVRRLAERTKSATEEIAATIRSIQEETRQTVEVMSSSSEAVNSGIAETARARESLEAIMQASTQVESPDQYDRNCRHRADRGLR
jgi:methyl-accepting chemotaxis protein